MTDEMKRMDATEARMFAHEHLYRALRLASREIRDLAEKHDLRIKVSITVAVPGDLDGKPRPHPPADLKPLDLFEFRKR